MNGKTFGNTGYIIIDYIDVDCTLESIRELADVLIAYPDTSSGAPTATAAFIMIRDWADILRDVICEMIGDTRLRINAPEMSIEEETK